MDIRRGGLAAAIACALAVSGEAVATPVAATSTTGSTADAFQIDAAHDGDQAGASITKSLKRAWAAPLYGAVASPVVAGNDVYAVIDGDNGTQLIALDLRTGGTLWGPINIRSPYQPFGGAAYDNGRVFTVNASGVVEAFDAASGHQDWATPASDNGFVASPPTAFNGTLYVMLDGYLRAVNESTGATLWQANLGCGSGSAPTVTSAGVFVSFENVAFDLDPGTGHVIWEYGSGCTPLGLTPSYHQGRLYIRDPSGLTRPAVLNASTGQKLGTYATTSPAAFDGTTGVFLNGTTLRAVNLSTGATPWTFTGDGALVSPPLIANGLVFESSANGTTYALSETTGSIQWRDAAGIAVDPPEGRDVFSGNAVVGDMLVVATHGEMLAYSMAPTPGPTVASVDPSFGSPQGGTSVVIHGSGLSQTTGVTFGASQASSYHVVSDSELVAVSPQHARGAVDIVASNGNGPSVSSRADLFAFSNPPPAVSDAAVTYQMDVAHTGTQTGDSLTVSPAHPLHRHWQLTLTNGGVIRYPLVVGNRVYALAGGVTSQNYNNPYVLSAFDAASGVLQWSQVVPNSPLGADMAYDAGRIFVVNGQGTVIAYDATTGALQWTTPMSGTGASTPPTAYEGIVYTNDAAANKLVALDESTGRILWQQPVEDGSDSPVSATGTDAYVAYACGQAYDFSTAGQLRWHHDAGCAGGGGGATPLYGGRLWMTQTYETPPLLLDQATGLEIGAFVSTEPPTFTGDTVVLTGATSVVADNASTGAPLWTASVSGTINVPPIIDNGIVYVATTGGYVYAFDAAHGTQLWRGEPGSAPAALAGIVAAQDMLLVPAGNTLIAYGP